MPPDPIQARLQHPHLREHQVAFQVVSGRSQAAFRIGGALAGLTYISLALVQLPGASLLVLIAIFSRMLPQVSGIHMNLQQLWQMAPAFDNWHRWVLACEAEAEPRDSRMISGRVPTTVKTLSFFIRALP